MVKRRRPRDPFGDALTGFVGLGVAITTVWVLYKSDAIPELTKGLDWAASQLNKLFGGIGNTNTNTNTNTDTNTNTNTDGSISSQLDKSGIKKVYETSGTEITSATPSHNTGRREWEVSTKGILHTELSFYLQKITGNDRVAVKILGGPHNDANPKDGCCLIVRFPFPTSSGGNLVFECPHPSYSTAVTIPTKFSFNTGTGLIGYKVIFISTGANSARLEAWVDDSGKINGNWRQWYVVEDVGKYASQINKVLNRNPINGTTPTAYIRIDNALQTELVKFNIRAISDAPAK